MEKKFQYSGKCSCGKTSHHKGNCLGVSFKNQLGKKREYDNLIELDDDFEDIEEKID